MEAHGPPPEYAYDRMKQAMMLKSDRAIALREAIMACRKGGTLSVPGVYGGLIDKVPFGAVMNKGLTVKTGQTHVQKYLKPLLDRIANGDIDPSFVVSHKLDLDDAAKGYDMFFRNRNECMKVVLKP
jgi:threonine dehydrogenase-like Zn-dependent dehydrogenase